MRTIVILLGAVALVTAQYPSSYTVVSVQEYGGGCSALETSFFTFASLCYPAATPYSNQVQLSSSTSAQWCQWQQAPQTCSGSTPACTTITNGGGCSTGGAGGFALTWPAPGAFVAVQYFFQATCGTANVANSNPIQANMCTPLNNGLSVIVHTNTQQACIHLAAGCTDQPQSCSAASTTGASCITATQGTNSVSMSFWYTATSSASKANAQVALMAALAAALAIALLH